MTKINILKKEMCINTMFSSRYYTKNTLEGNSYKLTFMLL